MKIVLVALNATYGHTNLAIRYLRDICLENERLADKIEIACCEYTINDFIRNILFSLYEQKADIYAFSCYIWNITVMNELSDLLRKILPGSMIVYGGPEVTYETESFFLSHPQVDFIVSGPGEATFMKLIEKLLYEGEFNNEKSSAEISSKSGTDIQMVTINYNGKKVYRNEGIDEIKDIGTCSDINKNTRILRSPAIALDDLSFPYTNEDFKDLSKQYYYESSRGCPFTCSYCLSSEPGRVEALTAERVKRDFAFFIDKQIKQVKLVDRTFNYDDKRAIEIWKFLISRYKENPFNTNFHFEIAGDLLSNEAIEVLMNAPVGIFRFEVGVQTTDEIVLDAIYRKSDIGKLLRNISKISKNGNIEIHLDLIAGLPGEDMLKFENSFNMVMSLRPDMLQLGFLKMLKGSKIMEDADKFDIKYSESPPYEVISTDTMSFTELNKLKNIETLLERYYNSGQYKHSLEFLFSIFGNEYFKLFESFEMHIKRSSLFERKTSRHEQIHTFYLFGCVTIEKVNYITNENKSNLYIIDDSKENSQPQNSILNDTSKYQIPRDIQKKLNIFRDLLKFDYYRFDRKGSFDELVFNMGAHHPDLPRELEKPEWFGEKGNGLCKKPRIEKFCFDVEKIINTGEMVQCETFVLYEMSGNKPEIIDYLIVQE